MALRRVRRLAGALVWLAMAFVASFAHATGRARVALVGAEPELAHAVAVALTPWGVRVSPAALELGDASPEAIARARALARESGVDAVVWLATRSGAPTLACVYDAESDRLSTRVLGVSSPYDDATAAAAAVALTLKAMLRSSAVAPTEERRPPAADPAATSPATPPTTPAPISTPGLVPAIAAASAPRSTAPDTANARRSATTRTFALEAAVAARLLTTTTADARVAVGAEWSPPGLPLALGLDATLGTGVDARSAEVDAHLADRALGLLLRRRVELGARLALMVGLGAGLDWTAMTGAAGPASTPFDVQRTDPTLDGTLRLSWRLGAASVGLSADLTYVLRPQDYTADGELVARLARWQPGGSLWLAVALF